MIFLIIFVHIRSHIVVGQAISCQYPVECQVDEVWVGYRPIWSELEPLLVPDLRGRILWHFLHAPIPSDHANPRSKTEFEAVIECPPLRMYWRSLYSHVAVACSRSAAFGWDPVSPLMQEKLVNACAYCRSLNPLPSWAGVLRLSLALSLSLSLSVDRKLLDCDRWARPIPSNILIYS